jgi:hypothetical protein
MEGKFKKQCLGYVWGLALLGQAQASIPSAEKQSAANESQFPVKIIVKPAPESESVDSAGKSAEIMELVPAGYEIKNVPGDGLCGFWATLLAVEALEHAGQTKITVTRKAVFELLKKLSDRIAYTLHKVDKSDEEKEMIEEIDQLIRDNYAKDHEDLCKKIETGSMQFDSPTALFVAQEIGYDIVIKSERNKDGKTIRHKNTYYSDIAKARKIMIYYHGDGGGGHYQAIIERGKDVHFN